MLVMDLQDTFVHVNLDIQDLIVKVRYKLNLSLTVKNVKHFPELSEIEKLSRPFRNIHSLFLVFIQFTNRSTDQCTDYPTDDYNFFYFN